MDRSGAVESHTTEVGCLQSWYEMTDVIVLKVGFCHLAVTDWTALHLNKFVLASAIATVT